MKKLLVLLILGAGVLFASLNYHFIIVDKNVVVEHKAKMSLEDTVVDARHWGITDYLQHPRIAAILVKHGIKSTLSSQQNVDQTADKAKNMMEKSKKALSDGLEKLQKKLDE